MKLLEHFRDQETDTSDEGFNRAVFDLQEFIVGGFPDFL